MLIQKIRFRQKPVPKKLKYDRGDVVWVKGWMLVVIAEDTLSVRAIQSLYGAKNRKPLALLHGLTRPNRQGNMRSCPETGIADDTVSTTA